MPRPEPGHEVSGASDVRGRIFASALRRFSDQGYAGTSLREITEDAHTTKPMIYYYFGSKEELYGKVVREILEEMTAAIREGLANETGDYRSRVLAYCRAYIGHFLNHEASMVLLLREVFGLGGTPLDALTLGLRARVRGPLDELLRAGMDEGEFKPDDPGHCARAISGILNIFILSHVFSHIPLNLEAPLGQVRHYITGLHAEAC